MNIDRYSQTWQAVETHLEDRLTTLRSKLEGELSPEETIATRARIREIRVLLEEARPEEPLTEPSDPIPE